MSRSPVVLAGCAALLLLLPACGQQDTGPAAAVRGGDPERGRDLVVEYGCVSCHAIPGVPGVADGVGSDLDDFAAQRYINGQVPNRPEELIRWIRDPQAIAPGVLMPDLGVTEQDARDIAAFLYGQ